MHLFKFLVSPLHSFSAIQLVVVNFLIFNLIFVLFILFIVVHSIHLLLEPEVLFATHGLQLNLFKTVLEMPRVDILLEVLVNAFLFERTLHESSPLVCFPDDK